MYYFFIAVYFGVTVGISPVISYNFGAKNKEKIDESLKYSFITIAWSSILIFLVSMLGGKYIIGMFTTDIDVFNIASHGIKLFSWGFLMIGVNVFISGYFTSIGNGKISAIISILRSLVFVTISVVVLPRFIGISGVWLSIPISELLTIIFSIYFYIRKGQNVLEYSA